tara:strand:+ start:545 stop:1120 length:576 start_codon:yes stop_codon:yes gene_type:complete
MADGTLKVGTITNSAGSGNITIGSGVTMTGAGRILQVVSVTKSDTYSESIAGNTMSSTNITGLTASLTPASTSNKILITGSIATGRDSNDSNSGVGVAMFRGGSLVGVGDAASSRTRVTSMSHHAADLNITTVPINFLDSPSSTSEQTYTFRFLNADGSTSNITLNKSESDADAAYAGRAISTITLMEIVA